MNVWVCEAIVQEELKIQEDGIFKRELHLKIEIENDKNKIWEKPKRVFILIKGICRETLAERFGNLKGCRIFIEGRIRVTPIQRGMYRQKLWTVEIQKLFLVERIQPTIIEQTKHKAIKTTKQPEENNTIKQTIIKSMILAREEVGENEE